MCDEKDSSVCKHTFDASRSWDQVLNLSLSDKILEKIIKWISDSVETWCFEFAFKLKGFILLKDGFSDMSIDSTKRVIQQIYLKAQKMHCN